MADGTQRGEPGGRALRRWARRLALVLVAAVAAGVVYLRRDHEAYFRARHGELVSWTLQDERVVDGAVRRDVRLVSSSGLQVDAALRFAEADGDAPRPTLLLLGGHETGRDAVDLVDDLDGVAVAAISYTYAGDPEAKGLSFLPLVWEARRALLDAPPSLLLAVDWLSGSPPVDPARIELVGVSLGAPLVCTAGALDERFGRVWAIHGGGRVREVFEHALEEDVPLRPLRKLAAALASLLVAPVHPERSVAGISPRPFVQVNAADDERIPRAAAEALFDAAAEPKELIWRDGKHVEPHREEVVAGLVGVVLERVRSEDGPADSDS